MPRKLRCVGLRAKYRPPPVLCCAQHRMELQLPDFQRGWVWEEDAIATSSRPSRGGSAACHLALPGTRASRANRTCHPQEPIKIKVSGRHIVPSAARRCRAANLTSRTACVLRLIETASSDRRQRPYRRAPSEALDSSPCPSPWWTMRAKCWQAGWRGRSGRRLGPSRQGCRGTRCRAG